MSPERRKLLAELVTTTGRYHRVNDELAPHDIPVDVAESIIIRLERIWNSRDAEASRLIANIRAGIER
jgi:hypothetical protein